MPLLRYDKTDLIEFFSALPEDGEDGIFHRWQVERTGLLLRFDVWPYDSDVLITIKRVGSPIDLVDLKLLGSPSISFYKEPREFIEVEAGQPAHARFGPHAKVKFGFRLFINPDLHVEVSERAQ